MTRNRERADKIVKQRLLRRTYEEIGQEFNLSRERVRQILYLHAPELTGPGKIRKKIRTPLKDNTCPQCGKNFYTLPSRQIIHCSRECYRMSRSVYNTVNPFRRPDKRYNHWRYKMEKRYFPEKLRASQVRSAQVHKTKLATNPEYRERYKNYIKNYLLRKKGQTV